jgi:diguanylate cyclase (GGDEF)-like protein/PAS domain S-box-containing protein
MENHNTDYYYKKMDEITDSYNRFVPGIDNKVNSRFGALRITLLYFIFGVLWILFSDMILEFLVTNPDTLSELQTLKGWFFILFTSVALYLILRRLLKKYKESVDETTIAYEELSAGHEELLAMDEELSRKYDELEENRHQLEDSNNKLNLIIQGTNDGIWEWDIQNDRYLFSTKLLEKLGYEKDEISTELSGWKSLLHPDDLEFATHHLENYLDSHGKIYKSVYKLRSKQGDYLYISSSGKAIFDEEGKPVRMVGSHTDITYFVNLQETIRQQQKFSDHIIKNTPLIILTFAPDGKITDINPYGERALGYRMDEIPDDLTIQSLIPRKTQEEKVEMYQEILAQVNEYKEISLRCKDGSEISALWSFTLTHDREEVLQSVVAVGINITMRKAAEKKLRKLAYHDSLTGLINRTMLEKTTNEYIIKDPLRKLAFLFLDIDNFKHINDTFGHDAGDKLLQYIARLLKDIVPFPSMVAKLSGDEFGILLADYTDIHREAKRIIDYLRRPWVVNNQEFQISVSMGIACYPDHGRNFSILQQHADTAMFDIKKKNKDDYAVFDRKMLESTWKHIEINNQLHSAIDKNEFVVYYQPKVDIHSGRIVDVEALIRWYHPDKGFLPPGDFIPFAEETGYINIIDEWVLAESLRQKLKWHKLGFHDLGMSVNISSRSLMSIDLVERVTATLKNLGINSDELELEVTETAVMSDINAAMKSLGELRKRGVKISLDDFGTGYSSLTYLKNLPIDVLKIDREFIKDVIEDDEEAYILKSVLNLAHNFGLSVVAEGIETIEQLELLKSFGCERAQGYYFSKPVPSDKITEMLIEQK